MRAVLSTSGVEGAHGCRGRLHQQRSGRLDCLDVALLLVAAIMKTSRSKTPAVPSAQIENPSMSESCLAVGQNFGVAAVQHWCWYPSESFVRPEAPNWSQHRIPSTNQHPISMGTK